MAKGKSGSKITVASLERSPSHLLHCALQLALDLYAEELGAGAPTQRQYAVLAAASAKEGATQAQLVRMTGIDRSTLADIAARMITKGLLERERSALDARANAVRLTEAGRTVLEEIAPKVQAADTRLLKRISGGKRRSVFLEMLQDVRGEAEKPAKAPKEKKASKVEKPKKVKKAA